MSVNTISRTIQEFRGQRYWLCGKYFQRYGRRLHVAVWAAHNGGEPPKGFHVHHKDGDRANNQPDNLELLRAGEHMSHHHKGVSTTVSPQALEEAAKWHRSDAGRLWHLEHYRLCADKIHTKGDFVCDQCGVQFSAQVTGANRFCSNWCKTKHRFLSGVDDVERSCSVCDATFMVNRYRKTRTCGRQCQNAALSESKRRRTQ